MELIEYVTKDHLRREDAAARLRAVADELSRHNELPFVREGVHYTVDVPDDVVFTLEIEVGKKKSEIEMKVKWRAAKE
jgi:amphi-Trp domain-containing protein